MNAVDKDLRSTLHVAAQNENYELAKLLRQNGVDVNAVSNYKDGTSPRSCERKCRRCESVASEWCRRERFE